MIGLVGPNVAVCLDEDVLAERAELEQLEGAPTRDTPLAVEEPATVAWATQRVESDGAEHEGAHRGERDQKRTRDRDVERALRSGARDVLRCARSSAFVPSR